jgi:hypothetical protein
MVGLVVLRKLGALVGWVPGVLDGGSCGGLCRR